MDLSYTSTSYNPPRIITLTTPINATHAYTFGIPPRNVSAVCINHQIIHGNGKSLWTEDRSLTMMPIFMLQLSLSIFLTSLFKFLLKPFGQAAIVGQIMGGIIAGPSVLARIHSYLVILLPFKSLYVLETISTFGCILYMFLVTVRMDIGMVRRFGMKEWAVGLFTFFLPMVIVIPCASLLEHFIEIDQGHKTMLKTVAILLASSTFHGIACILEDLNLLNSDLGRLAMSSSMISGFLSATTLIIFFALKQAKFHAGRSTVLCLCGILQMVVMGFTIRPLLTYMIKQTPVGEPMKEVYHCSVLLLVLVSSAIGEIFGQHGFFGPIWLGFLVPEGSVLAVTLVEKFEGFVSVVMLPLYFLSCGAKTDLADVSSKLYFAVQFLGLLSFVTKFISALIAAVCFCNLMPKEAVTLALILSTVGILDIQFYSRALQLGFIDYQCFGVMNTSAMVITGCISPVVKVLYDPSMRYASYTKRTVQHFLHRRGGGEIRILVCIHKEEQVPNIINLLEATNPTRENPMCVYLLHLVEQLGRASPLLIHQSLEKSSNSTSNNPTESIINAFRFFESSNEGLVTIQAFTAVAPFPTMHNDICTLSHDKRAALIIIPFHIQWKGSVIATDSPRFRGVNLNLLTKSPCSVGILIDRGNKAGLRPISGSITSDYRIGVFFLGGSDDREALALAAKFATHPHVSVTVAALSTFEDNRSDHFEEKRIDRGALHTFQHQYSMMQKVRFKESILADCAEMCRLIRSMENEFDLVLVGRRTESPLLEGLSGWNDFPELGLLGDMLASRDFRGKNSILVVQQHECHNPETSIYQYDSRNANESSFSRRYSSLTVRHQGFRSSSSTSGSRTSRTS